MTGQNGRNESGGGAVDRRKELRLGLFIYFRFGGWITIPAVFLSLGQGLVVDFVTVTSASAVILALSYEIGLDYERKLPSMIKPARLVEIVP